MSAPARLAACFARLKEAGRAGLGAFVTAGDPNRAVSMEILSGLAGAGADLIELGMPFSDPMADGPAIQASSRRALEAGWTMRAGFDLLAGWRARDRTTPVILMGYYNPIHTLGLEAFARAARRAGADGAIVVDLPPEEDGALRTAMTGQGLELIRLAAPNSNQARLSRILENAAGFLYYVSITGTTGAAQPDLAAAAAHLSRIRAVCGLPIALGFGIKTPAQAAQAAGHADLVVVGSALVEIVRGALDAAGAPAPDTAARVLRAVRAFSQAVHTAAAREKQDA